MNASCKEHIHHQKVSKRSLQKEMPPGSSQFDETVHLFALHVIGSVEMHDLLSLEREIQLRITSQPDFHLQIFPAAILYFNKNVHLHTPESSNKACL